MRQPLRVLVLRPEDDRQDQVLRGRPQARLQEVLRQVKQQTSFNRNIGFTKIQAKHKTTLEITLDKNPAKAITNIG